MPDVWAILLENVIVWTLSQEKRLRGYNIQLTIENISSKQMQRRAHSDSTENTTTEQQFIAIPSSDNMSKAYMNNLGHIYICSEHIEKYTQHQHLELYHHLISIGIDCTLKLQDKTNYTFKRKVMSKFGISSMNE